MPSHFCRCGLRFTLILPPCRSCTRFTRTVTTVTHRLRFCRSAGYVHVIRAILPTRLHGLVTRLRLRLPAGLVAVGYWLPVDSRSVGYRVYTRFCSAVRFFGLHTCGCAHAFPFCGYAILLHGSYVHGSYTRSCILPTGSLLRLLDSRYVLPRVPCGCHAYTHLHRTPAVTRVTRLPGCLPFCLHLVIFWITFPDTLLVGSPPRLVHGSVCLCGYRLPAVTVYGCGSPFCGHLTPFRFRGSPRLYTVHALVTHTVLYGCRLPVLAVAGSVVAPVLLRIARLRFPRPLPDTAVLAGCCYGSSYLVVHVAGCSATGLRITTLRLRLHTRLRYCYRARCVCHGLPLRIHAGWLGCLRLRSTVATLPTCPGWVCTFIPFAFWLRWF